MDNSDKARVSLTEKGGYFAFIKRRYGKAERQERLEVTQNQKKEPRRTTQQKPTDRDVWEALDEGLSTLGLRKQKEPGQGKGEKHGETNITEEHHAWRTTISVRGKDDTTDTGEQNTVFMMRRRQTLNPGKAGNCAEYHCIISPQPYNFH